MARFGLTSWQLLAGEFPKAMQEMRFPIARAATGAAHDAADIFKREGRRSIARGGLSRKWQNAFRVEAYPQRSESMEAAVHSYHNIAYAEVFEEGATISGKDGLLWVPTRNAPAKLSRRKRMRPAAFEQETGQPLISMSRGGSGRVPMLGARVRLPRSQADAARPKITMAALKRGAGSGRGVVRTVPIFLGLRQVTIRKRFSLRDVRDAVANRMPELYAMNFRDD